MLSENFLSTKNRSITDFEQAYSVDLPKDYAIFLEKSNGGIVIDNSIPINIEGDCFDTAVEVLYGLTSITNYDLYISYVADKVNNDDSLLCIGDCCFGDKLLISIKGQNKGNIYLCLHDDYDEENNNVIVKIYNSFDELMKIIL